MNQHKIINIKTTMTPLNWAKIKSVNRWFKPLTVKPTQSMKQLKTCNIPMFWLGSVEAYNNKIKIVFESNFSNN